MRHKPDWVLIVLFALLTAIGWISIFFTKYQGDFIINSTYGMQLIWIASLFLIELFIYVINHRFYYNFSAYFYLIFNILILFVFFFGAVRGGAKSCLGIGGFGIQPAEFAKYATCLLLARYVSQYNCDLTKWKQALSAATIILIPTALILLQNDTGTAVPFLFLVFALFREGLTPWILIIGFTAILLFILLIYISQKIILITLIILFLITLIYFLKKKLKIWRMLLLYLCTAGFILIVDTAYHKVLSSYKPHQYKRIELLFGKIDDPKGLGYNVNQAKIAIGSGGMLGKGFGKGTQTQLDFVPEQSTDFIFCTIGEEHGFIGTSLVILIYCFFIGRIVFLSEKSNNTFVRSYGYGIACIFFGHVVINIGMTIGLMPVIGIPLPFISYGGSSLWAFALMLFTFINLQAKTDK
jgi:rod shape determining protein RodA